MAKVKSRAQAPKFLRAGAPTSPMLQREFDEAVSLEQQNRHADAERAFAKLAISFKKAGLSPASCYACVGRTQVNQKKFTESLEALALAVKHEPKLFEAYVNLAIAYRELKNLVKAEEFAEKAIKLNPEAIMPRTIAGWAQNNLCKVTPCIQNFLAVLALEPENGDALLGLASIYSKIGDIETCIQLYRRALEVRKDSPELLGGFFFSLLYDPSMTGAKLLEEHLRYEATIGERGKTYWKPFLNDKTTGRRIRIGYMSGDFRGHVMRYFTEDVVTSHDRDAFEVFCFFNHPNEDQHSEKFKANIDHWVPVYGKTDDETDQLIRDKQIDILIDLSGHTGDNRMTLFARKPAPVQVTWMGYSSTTGLKAIDYIIVDNVIAPIEEESTFVEMPLRMPNSYTVYSPPISPEIGPLPKLENGYVTFGCFNNPSKVTNQQLELWAFILRAIPDAHIVFSYNVLRDALAQERIRKVLRECGVEDVRIEFASLSNNEQTAHGYNQVDISLDPSPYNGTTTTFEALWMGVPVITLPGSSFVSRTTASILAYAGLTGMICSTEEEYVQRVVDLAHDTDTLVRLRSEMRNHLLTTPVFQPKQFAKDLETHYREIFVKWCEQPA